MGSRKSSGGKDFVTTADSPVLRRSGRNAVSPNLCGKSKVLNKNSDEGSLSQRKSKKLVLKPGDELRKNSSPVGVEKRKVSVETSGSEEGEVKRTRSGRGYRNLFVEQHKKQTVLALGSIEEPKSIEKQPKSACCSIDDPEANAKEKHQGINDRCENKRLKNSDDIKDPDSSNRIAANVQFKGVITSGSNEPRKQNGDCEGPVNECETSPAKSDSLKSMASKKFKCVSTAPVMEVSPECGGEIQATLVSSCDNKRYSSSVVESDRVEADSERQTNLVQADSASRDCSRFVDVNVEYDEENIHIGNADDLTQCDDVTDSAHAPVSNFAKNTSSPRKHRFVEYWVPARLSNLQLEQYCSELLSRSISLRSSSRSDPVGAMRSLLVTLRQTCSHPFLVDLSLSSSLLKDVKETEYLDVGIKASGKLQLLDSMLFEMRKQGLRVLILYESIDGRDGIGDILDDFLRQRYGQDSYERVDGGGFIPSKRQAALNKFNDKESGRFAFLLETHACLPSIKLSSVDVVIIHNSDWNPVSDIRALQRIVIDSQQDPIKLFRLFLSQTVEENAMLLAKHNVTLDNSMHNINQRNRDKLLMNGAPDLFGELERFHCVNAHVSTVISSMESSLLQDVVQELMTILLQSGRQMVDGQSVCLKVQRNDGDHAKYYLVSDELNPPREMWPSEFWSELLEGRNPQWKYVPRSNQRNRKRVRYDKSKDSQSYRSENVKRHKKVVTDTTSAIENEKVVESDKESECDEHLSESLHLSSKSIGVDEVCRSPEVHSNDAVKSGNMHQKIKQVNDTPEALFLKLKPELGKLCEVLNMPEDVKSIAERFLQFAIEYHGISSELVTMLQAFQLSVCWVAASWRKQNIDCQESLALAKQHLEFCCSEDDTDYMSLKMGLFKELFIHHIVNDKSNDLAPEELMIKIIKQINKKCRQRLEILSQKQFKENEQLQKSIEVGMAQLDQWYILETDVVRSIHAGNSSVAASKIKEIEDQFTMKLEELQNSNNIRLKSLKDKHLSEKDRESTLTSGWKEDIVREQLKILRKLPLSVSENCEQTCIGNNQLMVRDGYKNGCLVENQETSKTQPDVLAERAEVQSGVPEGLPTLPATALEAIYSSVGVDSEVSTSAEVQMEASNLVNQTSDIDVLKSSSVDVQLVTSQQLSPSAKLISGNVLLSTPTIDGSQSYPRDKAVGNQHESEALSTDPIVALPPSPPVPDNEVNNSSSIQNDFEVPASEGVTPSNDVGHSSTEPSSGRPILQVQPSQGINSIQNTEALNVVVNNNIEHPNSSQSLTCVRVPCQPTIVASAPAALPAPRDTRVTSNIANIMLPDATNASTVPSRVSFAYMDPLQGELERIEKLADYTIKIYEDQKQHLNSECEKEIREIRKKYEAKSLELDAAFTSKKKDLDCYHKKVFMNKKLAEAFQNKCMELKTSAPPGISQDNRQRQMPRPLLVSGQQMVPGASSAIQTSGNLQPTHSSMRPRNLQGFHNPLLPSGHAGATTQTLARPGNPIGPSRFSAVQTTSTVASVPRQSSSSGLPSAYQYRTPPLRNQMGTTSPLEAVISLPVQTGNGGTALFSSNSSWQAVSAASTPPVVNLHSSSEFRAHPPHLRAVSQPPKSNQTFSSLPPTTFSQTQYTNVSRTATSTNNPNGPLSVPATSNVVCLSDED